MFCANRSLSRSDRAVIRAATRDPAVIYYATRQKRCMFTAFMPKQALYHRCRALTVWRDVPPMLRSLAELPGAPRNGGANKCGSPSQNQRFLRTTRTGRVLVRWLLTLLRSDVRLAALGSRWL